MLKTPIDKKRLKHHWQYMRFPYIAGILAVLLACGMYGDSVNARIDTADTLEVFFCGSYITEDAEEAFAEYMASAVPDIGACRTLNISSDLLSNQDYAMQQILVYLSTGQGDVYILPDNMFRVIQNNGLILPLDGALADGSLTAGEALDLTEGYRMVTEKAWSGEVISEEGPYLMAIPASELWGLWTQYGFDNRDKYILVGYASENLRQCVTLLNDMAKSLKGDPPEWLPTYEAYEKIKNEENLKALKEAVEGTPLEIVENNGDEMLGYYGPR